MSSGSEKPGNKMQRLQKYTDKVLDSHIDIFNLDMTNVAHALELKYHGQGAERSVISFPGDEKVFAIDFNFSSEFYAKGRFYSQFILNTLFPDNFPAVYGIYRSPNAHIHGERQPQGIIAEKIHKHEIYDKINELDSPWRDDKGVINAIRLAIAKHQRRMLRKASLNTAIKTLRSLGIYLRIDNNTSNFMLDVQGREFYVDSILLDPPSDWDWEKIDAYMDTIKLSEQKKGQVHTAAEKLQAAYTQNAKEKGFRSV